MTREEIALAAAYEAEQTAIRKELGGQVHRNCQYILSRWAQFQTDLAEGGRFEALAGAYAEDAAVMTAEEVAALVGAMQAIVATVEAVEEREPGLFL